LLHCRAQAPPEDQRCDRQAGLCQAAQYLCQRLGRTSILTATIPSPRIVSTVATVPSWLSALSIVSISDAVATCPRRLAERMACSLGPQIVDADFAGPRLDVAPVR